MRTDPSLAAMRRHYELGLEQERLTQGHGRLEFERTKEILRRHLPPPPAVIADIGGGPGRYALWLADLGYEIEHRDLIQLHVDQVHRASGGNPRIRSEVCDARRLDLETASVDAVLVLGPLYHLDRRGDRLRVLAEAHRVVRPGGPVFAAAISRWAARLDGILRARPDDAVLTAMEAVVASVERSGRLPPLFPDSFCGYAHRPGQLRAELVAAGLEVIDLVCVEGPAFLLHDLGQRLDDDQGRRVVLETCRALERVPELLGIGPHLLATARQRSRIRAPGLPGSG
jgi:SAM-dependent methyltransferase